MLRLTVCVYLHSNFSGGRRKTFLFLQEGRFSRSRSSKVNNIGANRKRVCDFLLVRNSTRLTLVLSCSVSELRHVLYNRHMRKGNIDKAILLSTKIGKLISEFRSKYLSGS